MQDGKIAIVVFVKNEVHDFASWISWHFAMGCDTLLVYDDHSADGTWELAVSAGHCLDVRCFRTDANTTNFMVRQRQSYLDAIARFGSEFEWLGFFDADEFVFTDGNEALRPFLSRFPDAEAVALHWCNYGSSGHVMRPAIPVMEAFTRHSSVSSPINHHIKSFIRPAAFRGGWENVHYFAVDPDRYKDSTGCTVVWSDTLGITVAAPNWDGGKVMHYQCRSMEQFIERLRRRPDLTPSTDVWRSYDVNDIEDRRCLDLMPAVYRVLARLQRQIAVDLTTEAQKRLEHSPPVLPPVRAGSAFSLWRRARPTPDDHGPGEPDARTSSPQSDMKFASPTELYFVRTSSDTYLCWRRDHVFVTHCPISEIDMIDTLPVVAAHRAGSEVVILDLMSVDACIEHEPRFGQVMPLTSADTTNGTVLLLSPANRRYLCAIPQIGTMRQLIANRSSVGEWEQYRLVHTLEDGRQPRSTVLRHMPLQPLDGPSALRWFVTTPAGVSSTLVRPLLGMMKEDERIELARLGGPRLPKGSTGY